jgi:uncharacterized membrane protein
MRTANVMATVLLTVVSLAHLLRLIFGVPVTVADRLIPMWVSGVAVVVAGAMAWMVWRAGRKE